MTSKGRPIEVDDRTRSRIIEEGAEGLYTTKVGCKVDCTRGARRTNEEQRQGERDATEGDCRSNVVFCSLQQERYTTALALATLGALAAAVATDSPAHLGYLQSHTWAG